MADSSRSIGSVISSLGLVLGPVAAVATYLALPGPTYDDAGTLIGGIEHPARATASLGILMATWWLTEAIHITATALMPVVLLPLLGVMGVRDAASPYAHPILFLFFGGFIIGLAMQKWGLHKRTALATIRVVGGNPARVILGFMITAAVLSMWVSNTATTLLMIPIASSVIALLAGSDEDSDPLAKALLLGIAYASSIGGTATLVGTAPNIFLAGHLEDRFDIQLSMMHWLLAMLPGTAVFILLSWLVLTRWTNPVPKESAPGLSESLGEQIRALGRVTRGEWIVLVVFAFTALLWITRPLVQGLGRKVLESHESNIIGHVLASLSDASIAMLAAIALFLIPVRRGDHAMDWRTAERGVPWGILILLGGGFSLANAVTSTGLDAYIANSLSIFAGVPEVVLIILVVAVIVMLTELTSNTATTTTLVPILGAAAPALGVDPIRLLVPATIAASYAFMLPVATPPNAIAFSTGRLQIRDMARAGLPLNIIGIGVTVGSGYFVSWVLQVSGVLG